MSWVSHVTLVKSENTMEKYRVKSAVQKTPGQVISMNEVLIHVSNYNREIFNITRQKPSPASKGASPMKRKLYLFPK